MASTTPQLVATVRMLLQFRLLLTAIALLLLPRDRVTPSVFVVVCAFALLTWLLIRYWERLTPYLLRWPSLFGADALVAGTVLALDGPTGPFFVATVLTSTLTGLLFGRLGVILMAMLQILCYGAALISQLAIDPLVLRNATFQVLVMHPALYPIAGFVGLRLRSFFDQFLVEQEARRTAELLAAAADERNRLARDMHDSVAKTLRGAAMAAQSLPLWIERDSARAASTALQISQACEVAAKEARALIGELRSADSVRPISETVRAITEEWAVASGGPVEVSLTSAPLPLLVTARHEMSAILQEALTNIERHAARSRVSVTLDVVDSHAELRVADDGPGFDAARTPDGHFGLIGMEERAQHASGTFEVDSAPGKGTTIVARFPLSPAADNPLALPPTFAEST